MLHQSDKVSPHPSDSENTQLVCSPTQSQDSFRPATSTSSSPTGPEGSASQTSSPQAHIGSQVHYQVPHQHQVSKTLGNVQSSVLQPPHQVQALVPQVQVSHDQPSGCCVVRSSPPPMCLSISVPQQQIIPTSAPASLSKHGDNVAVQQLPQNSEFSCFIIKNPFVTFKMLHHS